MIFVVSITVTIGVMLGKVEEEIAVWLWAWGIVTIIMDSVFSWRGRRKQTDIRSRLFRIGTLIICCFMLFFAYIYKVVWYFGIVSKKVLF